MSMFRIIPENPDVVKEVKKTDSLTVEQVYQFVLQQTPGSTTEYRMVKPYSSLDVSQIVQSAVIVKRIAVTHQPTDDPYVMKLYVGLIRSESHIL